MPTNEVSTEIETNDEVTFEPSIQATVTISIKELLGSTCNEYDFHNETLSDQIRQEVIDRIVKHVAKEIMDKNFKSELRNAIKQKVNEEVEYALCGEYQPTNAYGTPKGQPTSLRAGIDAHIAKWANERSDDYSSTTKMNAFIKNQVNKQIEEDLHGVVTELRSGIRNAAKDRIGFAIADIISGLK